MTELNLDLFTKKHNSIMNDLEILYSKYNFNDIYEYIKTMKGNYENSKIKFSIEKKESCFNYLIFFEMYVTLLNHEKNFVMFAVKNNSIESNINKGVNNYIVSQCGYRWTKIISKNKDVVNNSFDPDYYEDYCIMDDIEKFINESNETKYLPFNEKPELCVVFYEIPNENVCDAIRKKNISIISFNRISSLPVLNNYEEMVKNIDVVNIDVNIIITICSELSNLKKDDIDEIKISPTILSKCVTGANMTLEEIVNNRNNILEIISKYKRRIICQSAYDKIVEFAGILADKQNFTKEITRLKSVINDLNIEVVQDRITPRIQNIKHPNALANNVFGSGDYYGAITITGYSSYINYAKQKRINIASIICNSVEFSEKYLS